MTIINLKSVLRKFSMLAILFVLINSIAALAQTKLIEKVEKKGDEIVIPYEKYLLNNGLTLIVHEDHSDPVVHIDVTYHVGSAREQIARSGFAHFFEHMMFQGSDNVADEEHFKTVTEAGGNLNGTTNSDRTNYFETMPSNQLEIGLWLEADRMGFLLDAVTQKKFEIQRSTVKNERGQSYDNRPYGLVFEKTAAALYPYGHPYSWSTIGSLEDLDRVDVNDLKKFFLRWYGPNNAVVTVAGDVNTQTVVKLVEKYFGSINRGPQVLPQPKTPVTLDKDRYISYQDNIRFPLLMMAFPSVPNRHPDEAPLDILSDILGGGKNSIFYKNFIKSQIAVDARVSNPCAELAGIFTFTVLPIPGKNLAQIEEMMRLSIKEFEERGVTDEDLIKYKASYESQTIGSLSSVSGKASQLAAYQTFTGNANYIKEDMARYLKVTKEDVMRVYNQYIKDKPCVLLSVYPKGQADIVAKPDNYTPKKADTTDTNDSEYKDLVYNKSKDSFDRSKKPLPGSNPVVNVPAFWKSEFKNGLKIIGSKSEEIPLVVLRLSIEAGHIRETKDKAGIAQLMAALIQESNEKYTAEQFSVELEKLGSSISVEASSESIDIVISSLKKNLDATLKLAELLMMKPKFSPEEFDMVKNNQLEGISNQVTQPTVIADNIYRKLLYGEKHIFSVPEIGTTETVTKITLEDVKTYYKENINPTISKLVIVGDVEQKKILDKLTFLKNWQGKALPKPVAPIAAKIDKTKIFLADKEKAAQSEIRIGYLAMPYDATGEYYKSTVMNYELGGNFNSRINLNLREAKGYTYGARANFSGTEYVGSYTASAGVRANVTDSSVIEFMKEINNYKENGITDEELAFTKSSLAQRDALRYETLVQKAGFLQRILDYNLPSDYVKAQTEILNNIKKEEINALAKKHLPSENMVITVVGDKKVIAEGLSKLGYEVVEVDLNGNIIKKQDDVDKVIYPKN